MNRKWNSPKEYLSQVKDLDNLIQTNVESMTELKNSMFGVTKQLKSDKVQSSNSYDFTDTIAKICDMEKQTNKYIDDLVDLRDKIENEIKKIDNNIQTLILINHYVLGKSLVEISEEYNYGNSYIKRAHGWALESFKERFPDKFYKE